MSIRTLIEYADSTINPVTGCGGCELWNEHEKTCYAGFLTEKRAGNPGYPDAFLEPKQFPGRMQIAANWSDLSGKPRPGAPWQNDLPRIIFISDMGDALSVVPGHDISFEYLKSEIIDVVSSFNGRRHLWFWLTKRPARMALFDQWLWDQDIVWPDNLIAATSITGAAVVPRIASLRRIRAKYRALSVEPLREPVTLNLDGIDWVIVGGESRQAKAAMPRPFDLDWARSIREQCHDSGKAFFFKQAGSNPLEGGLPRRMKDHHGGDWNEFPDDLRLREFPASFMRRNQLFGERLGRKP